MAGFHPSLDRRKGSWCSIWTVVLAVSCLAVRAMAAEKTQADYFVHSLPGQPDGPLLKMHAGYDAHSSSCSQANLD